MTDFSYQPFLVKSQSREGIILYRGDRPLAVFLNEGANPAKLVKFVLETVGIAARDLPLIASEAELALIEQEAKTNENLLPRLSHPEELLRSYFIKE